MSIQDLTKALGITKEQARVMTAVSSSAGKTQFQANGVTVWINGPYTAGTKAVIMNGIIVSIVPDGVVVYTD